MKQIISALFLCMLLSAVPGLQAQNIQLHYDFGRSLYDKGCGFFSVTKREPITMSS